MKIAPKETCEYIKEEDWEDWCEKINPFEISSYRAAKDFGGSTAVFFKNGQDMIVILAIKEFEKILNEHQK